LTGKTGLITERPFKNPHHTVSQAGLIGGGSIPKPGEVSLAHLGVLFLDELPEFDRGVLEVLRQPMEDKQVTISRAATSLTFPSSFTLVASMNPCPCGYFGSSRECKCSPVQIQRYVGKISGPLLDRIDIHIDVPAVNFKELRGRGVPVGDSSEMIRARVIKAREIQLERFAGEKVFLEFGDGAGADSPVLRSRFGKRKSPGTRDGSAGIVSPRARPDFESGENNRGSGSERKHSIESHQRSDQLPLARPQLLVLKFLSKFSPVFSSKDIGATKMLIYKIRFIR
jgi:hypothetical protein